MKLDELRLLVDTHRFPVSSAEREMLEERLRRSGLEPGQFYQELEMSSRFVDSHRDTSFSNAHLSLHSHAFYEILYCRSSGTVDYLLGPDRYRLQRGDIVVVPPGVSHRPILPEHPAEPYVRDVVWVSSELMNQVTTGFPDPTAVLRNHTMPIRTLGTRWEFLGDLFRAGVRESELREPGWEIFLLGNTLTIFALLKRAYIDRTAKPMKAEQPELLDKLTAFIEENYALPLTLEDLAARFYVSSSTVSHLFKQKMGISIYRYVTQRRLIAAKELIAAGNLLETVSAQTGFSDYSAFYRAFKREYGISPKQYRAHQ